MPTSASWLLGEVVCDADLDAILRIDRESSARPWTRAMFEAELAQRDMAAVHVIKTVDNEVAGFCAVRTIDHCLEINALAVAVAHRRQGAGRALLEHVLELSERHGAWRALLEVRASNTPARSLYERLGFTVAAVRPGYYSHPDDDGLLLERRPAARHGAPA